MLMTICVPGAILGSFVCYLSKHSQQSDMLPASTIPLTGEKTSKERSLNFPGVTQLTKQLHLVPAPAFHFAGLWECLRSLCVQLSRVPDT